ncbi:DUF1854 domain-containing protein [Herbaspirillum sp. LeCh32-8]|uniref:cyanophycin metabolism-associated DUF1854 family protein n=1 Tax=Herbaspirillum sp. LeCh32-8 TaxID=2821356 RepID=UPI001AE2C98E|nr:DUF1854 domain-containing protein [Herbaspirillum sp. LeCh32-8]MBP0597102.1 DUF1854 domain-containing protein [Herbaspirillum sp. LeCh32-8]
MTMTTNPAQQPSFGLHRNSFGRLVFTGADGASHENVIPVRAFPVSAPDGGVSVVSSDGHELAWIDRLEQVEVEARKLIEEELASREFMPEICRIVGVSTFATPSDWTVQTSRGVTTFTLKGEEDIRRLPNSALLIADSHSIQFLVRDLKALDKHSRKILDRFL